MSGMEWILCVIVILASLAGGLIPLAYKVTHTRLQTYLALSGGVMLGASFFHMIPESAHLLGDGFGFYVVIGVLGLYFVQRFLAPHSHEMDEFVSEENACSDDHSHDHAAHSAGPSAGHAEAVSSWAVITGLSLHSLVAGIALGGAMMVDETLTLSLTVFAVVALHKPADSLTISALLLRQSASRRRIILCQVVFSLLVPLGIAVMLLGGGRLSGGHESTVTGIVMAVTAGMFICISLGDLLPEVQFHQHDRFKLSLALIAGVALMGMISFLEPEHHHGSAEPATPEQHSAEAHTHEQ